MHNDVCMGYNLQRFIGYSLPTSPSLSFICFILTMEEYKSRCKLKPSENWKTKAYTGPGPHTYMNREQYEHDCWLALQRHRAPSVGGEDGGSETRRQLSLLSRLRQLLNKLKNQLDDDGENITAARLRELKVRESPISNRAGSSRSQFAHD